MNPIRAQFFNHPTLCYPMGFRLSKPTIFYGWFVVGTGLLITVDKGVIFC